MSLSYFAWPVHILPTLTPLQTHDNKSRTLYLQELHQPSQHSESLFLWSHGRRGASNVLSLFRLHVLPMNDIPHLYLKWWQGNVQHATTQHNSTATTPPHWIAIPLAAGSSYTNSPHTCNRVWLFIWIGHTTTNLLVSPFCSLGFAQVNFGWR